MVMRDELVGLEIAKLAKSKNFNIPVKNYINSFGKISEFLIPSTYDDDGDGNQDVDMVGRIAEIDYNFEEVREYYYDYETNGNILNQLNLLEVYSAPTQSLLQRWLREIHEIHIEITSKKYKTKVATCIPRTFKYIINGVYSLTFYNSYEEALDEGLLQGLKLI